MSGYASFGFEIDRLSAAFNFGFDYTIYGYGDPETGEYFGDTTWSVGYGLVGGPSYGSSGYAGESWSETIPLGLDTSPGLKSYNLDFAASNWFSGQGITAHWVVHSVAYDTADQTINGGSADEVIIGGFGDDILRGSGGNDIFDGGEGDDIIDGGAGADRLDGGDGDDVLVGGADDDLYIVNSRQDTVVEKSGGGTDTVWANINYTLAENVERLVLFGTATQGVGNGGANVITGNALANTLFGMGGNDDLRGGAGVDKLYGGEGDDVLDGGTGNDTMDGGAGDDTFIVDSTLDKLIEGANGGIDTARAVATLASYTLGANVDNLQTLRTASFHGIGNNLANNITGGIGNDRLEGWAGKDILVGGLGNDVLAGGTNADELRGGEGIDTADYANSFSAVRVNLTTGQGSGGDSTGDLLFDVENLIGSDFGDTLTGSAADNVLSGGIGDDKLYGLGGNDTLAGGSGADVLDGGEGSDTLDYSASAGAVQVDLVLGTAAGGDAAGDTIFRFESVTGGAGADRLTGNGDANTLQGGAGADIIKGGGGNDVLRGGAGADYLDGGTGSNTLSYSDTTVGVTINLASMTASGGAAEGDTILNFDHANGSSGDDIITGNDLANSLWGSAGTDKIDGGDGNDVVGGGAGADDLDGGTGNDTLTYQNSRAGGVVVMLASQQAYGGDANGDVIRNFENVEGSELGDALYGDSAANRLNGRAGYDFLDGGAGNDVLTGGTEADIFYFAEGYGRDRVVDFSHGQFDQIWLQLGPAYDTFAEVMAAAHATGSNGQDTLLTFDTDTSLLLSNVAIGTLTAADFSFGF